MSRDQDIRDLHRLGFEDLNAFWEQMDGIEAELAEFSTDALSFVEEQIERTVEKIRSFEPSVSVIGQVKAGKSTLLNALIGETSLLPSDVNPWTSVITGVHLNSRNPPPGARAIFRFFDAMEWDRLVETGGRLGEMANRAGFESEATEVKAQVRAMRQTTESRLGAEFDRLLGSSHAFPAIDKAMIDRYICYGDPEDIAEGAKEGVYADLTKSADLYIDLPGYPRGLCLRDTPGVNDTFMMREQITLNAISESRVCVVVLSAHQALSTMDLALLRIICSVSAREVLIFVNRIDELVEPRVEIEKIRASIDNTLERLGVGSGIEILFGSGYWANCALDDKCARMAPTSRAALQSYWQGGGSDLADPTVLRQMAMEASGVGALHRAIARRIVEGPGQAILRDVQTEIDAIVKMSETVISVAEHRPGAAGRSRAATAGIADKVAALRSGVLDRFDADCTEVRAALHERLTRAQGAFVTSAVAALQSHIDAFGEAESWNHDPGSLRMAMRTAFLSSATRLRRMSEERYEDILEGVRGILHDDLGVFQQDEAVEYPEPPEMRSPTNLARTLSLDLHGPWWRKFWRFGARQAAQKRYKTVIEEETTPLVVELLGDFFDPLAARTRNVVEAFAADQARFIGAVVECMEHERDAPLAVIGDRLKRSVA